MKGTIKKLLGSKKCGFVRGEDNVEYFFHASAIKNARFENLREGSEVEFEEGESGKGPRAEEVYLK